MYVTSCYVYLDFNVGFHLTSNWFIYLLHDIMTLLMNYSQFMSKLSQCLFVNVKPCWLHQGFNNNNPYLLLLMCHLTCDLPFVQSCVYLTSSLFVFSFSDYSCLQQISWTSWLTDVRHLQTWYLLGHPAVMPENGFSINASPPDDDEASEPLVESDAGVCLCLFLFREDLGFASSQNS